MIVEVDDLRKSFGSTAALSGVGFGAEAGSVLGILGPNGAGKTTTVRILTTLLRPDGGTVRVAGHDVVREARRVRAAISLTGQAAAVDGAQTGRENLVMIGRLMHLSGAESRTRADGLLDRFGLRAAAHRRVTTYSGGMRRRLDLAMSLIGRPRVIFLDEPTTGLDPASRLDMWTAIRELVDDGTTVLLTTQYLEEADRLADRIVLIDGGRVAAQGTAAELKRAVGGRRLEFTFPGTDAFARGARVLVDGIGDADARRISVASDGSADTLRRLLRDLDGVPLATVTEQSPTLDDVFLTLTGHRSAPERQPEPQPLQQASA
jgi:ABC-2 type transport system ATP-binding protein